MEAGPGRIVVLNGAPRSGKSSIAAVIQGAFDGVWMNLGMDVFGAVTPERLRPGLGLRPGGERPDLEALLPTLHAGLYGSIAAHSRAGLNVVVDVGHHEGHTRPLGLLPACARSLAGLPALLVGVPLSPRHDHGAAADLGRRSPARHGRRSRAGARARLA